MISRTRGGMRNSARGSFVISVASNVVCAPHGSSSAWCDNQSHDRSGILDYRYELLPFIAGGLRM